MYFIDYAIAAGFTKEQAVFMEAWLASDEHSHDIKDIEGLEEALEGDEDGDEED